MNKEEFVKSIGLVEGALTGSYFDLCPGVDAHEFCMVIYLGREGQNFKDYKYLYSRLMMTELSLQNQDWKRILQFEYKKLAEEMYDLAQTEFNPGLEGVVVAQMDTKQADLDEMTKIVEGYVRRRFGNETGNEIQAEGPETTSE